jgi:hypothetical protein
MRRIAIATKSRSADASLPPDRLEPSRVAEVMIIVGLDFRPMAARGDSKSKQAITDAMAFPWIVLSPAQARDEFSVIVKEDDQSFECRMHHTLVHRVIRALLSVKQVAPDPIYRTKQVRPIQGDTLALIKMP